MAQVALESAGARQRYGLALEPDPETITVQVDGVTQAETELGATFGWWFEPESQKVFCLVGMIFLSGLPRLRFATWPADQGFI